MSNRNTTITPMTTTGKRIIMISKILIAIDGSDASMDAADYAISISKQYNAELYALHVIHPADADLFGPTGEMSAAAYYTIDINKEAQEYLDKAKLKANENNIHIITEIIASTDTAEGIVDYAEDKDMDLIVIGTRGKSGFKKILLGSVASKVVTYAHCPVMVVKQLVKINNDIQNINCNRWL